MSQWLANVVAKVKKWRVRRAVARSQWSARLGVEGFGDESSLGSGRSLPVRPAVEQLEERRLMSSSGVISAITDNAGQTAVFALGTDLRVYEYSPTQTHGQWQALSDPWAGTFRQVSAGLDSSGRAICYAIHSADSAVWRLDDYGAGSGGFAYHELNLGLVVTQISGTRNNECFAINGPSAQWLSIYNAANNTWRAWNGPWGGLVQISTGVDRYGGDEAYLLNGSQQVYRLDNGAYWALPMHATQISAGAGRNWTDTDLFYIDPSNSYAYHYDGSGTQLMAMYVSQISAGLDRYGNEVLYSIDMYYHGVRRNDMSGNVNGQYEGGNVSQISAAGNDMVFAVAGWDTSIWEFDRNGTWNSYWAATNNPGSGGWHALNGATASPYYAPLAA
jgi:hypothetical protein